jgi:putative chitinase
MNITPALIESACGCTNLNGQKYADALAAACTRYGITSPQRLAAFLAQIAHESGSLSTIAESFDYSVPALAATFPRVMTTALASSYGRRANERFVPIERQTQIANLVYANRYGNGDPASGDGWRYRGSGLLQITFRANFVQAGKALGIDLENRPDLLRTDASVATLAAAFFWNSRGLNALADASDFDTITRRINPAMAGSPDRRKRWSIAKAALGIPGLPGLH